MREHAPKVSENTQKSYSTSLKHLIPIFGELNLTSILPKMISRYKVLRKDEGAKSASINRELSMFSKALNLAVKEWEWIKDNPVSRVSKEKEKNRRDRWLTKDEEVRLIKNSPERLKEIIIFGLNTGLRLGELISLEFSKVNVVNKTILIDNTKNGEQRTIPLNKYALNVVEQRSRVRTLKNDYVFLSRDGGRVNSNSLRVSFHKSLEKAKITNFRLHDLRHSFATSLAQKGVDLYRISKLLGHKDISMTQRYAHHSPESLRSGVEVLEFDYNLTTVEENEI